MSSRGVGTVIGKFYERHILPHVVGCACGSRPIQPQRAKIVPLACGSASKAGPRPFRPQVVGTKRLSQIGWGVPLGADLDHPCRFRHHF